jgi:branched-chain amino acid transport system permease protein
MNALAITGALLPVLVDGLFLGALLGLVSLGLAVSYSVFRFPNFAHAEIVTLGAYGAWAGAALAGGGDAPLLAALCGAAAALLAALAALLLADRLVLRRLLAQHDRAAVIIAAFALGLLLRNLVVLLVGPGDVAIERGLEIALPVWDAPPLDAARLTPTEWGVIGATLALAWIGHVLLRRSVLGRQLRALAENPSLAGVCGIRVPRVRLAAWAVSGVFCAIAGGALALLGPIRPQSGAEFMLPALAAVILGGLHSIGGALAGAMLIGLAEAAAVHLGLAEWRQVVSLALVALLLCLRPRGLAGGRA